MTDERFHIGLIQLPVAPDKEATIASHERAIREAAERGARIVCLQELFDAPPGDDQPTARAVSMITGEHMDIEGGPNVVDGVSCDEREFTWDGCLVFGPHSSIRGVGIIFQNDLVMIHEECVAARSKIVDVIFGPF